MRLDSPYIYHTLDEHEHPVIQIINKHTVNNKTTQNRFRWRLNPQLNIRVRFMAQASPRFKYTRSFHHQYHTYTAYTSSSSAALTSSLTDAIVLINFHQSGAGRGLGPDSFHASSSPKISYGHQQSSQQQLFVNTVVRHDENAFLRSADELEELTI